jgi:hypothetical protein
MRGISLFVAFALAAFASAGDETSTEAAVVQPPPVKRALNKVFRGRVVRIKKKKVTLYYDFENPEQLQDFEEARPPRLLDATQNRVSIQGGRLVLEGSSAIRHKLEGVNEIRARFSARLGQKRNVGTVFTEPLLSDFYVVLNLFDERFYEDGGMILAACGLHEDEGADTDMSMVNWRDIFKSNVDNKVKVGQDVEIEVAKDGFEEYCRVADVEGKGSSRGKCREMKICHFGLWVHQSRATFDDLTLVVEPSEKFLDLNDLKAEIEVEWEEAPATGPFAGIEGVPAGVVAATEAYAGGGGSAAPLFEAMWNASLPPKAREAVCQTLCARSDPKAVALSIDGLYREEKLARELTIRFIKKVTGKDFGYSAGAGEKARSKAIQALNDFLAKERAKYFQ